MIATGYVLVALAGLLILVGAYPAAVFLCLAAGGVAIAAPTPDQRDARRRNHARRVR